MTITITEFESSIATEPRGGGALSTELGNLPLHRLTVRTAITAVVSRTELVQAFRNTHDAPLEATYIFPLPDRGAVTAMTMTADDRTIVADLRERAAARQTYDDAIAAGRRASIAEEERPDIFTMRVGNIAPGERVEIALTIVGPLPFEDGEATFRFPLVVAPRYIPGRVLDDAHIGDGWGRDTDSTPDASRITPPVLLPGFPNPVDLSIEVTIDPAGLPLGPVRSSLHAISTDGGVVRVVPGARVDRDFVLRLAYGGTAETSSSLSAVPDDEGDEGTFQLTVIPPAPTGTTTAKDVVLLLDRSGSMGGWKMVAARRAAARIVDTLTALDRFTVLTFDHAVEAPDGLPAGLVEATDRNRFRAVEHLSRVEARGGTELLEPLERGLRLLTGGAGRDRVLVLVTDGQVGNEDQLLRNTAALVSGVRVHTVGIDRAVNAGFLGRLAVAGGGRCELVESEDRLDEAMDAIHRRIGAPLITGLQLSGSGLDESTLTPDRFPAVFTGVPLVLRGRYRGPAPALRLTGTARDDSAWQIDVAPAVTDNDAITRTWARATLRDLEDGYAVAPDPELEQRIVATSLRFGVLCRFTAFLAVDSRLPEQVGDLHRVVQPVEPPDGWAQSMAMPMHAAMPESAPSPAIMSVPASAAAPAAPAGATRVSGGVWKAASTHPMPRRIGGRAGEPNAAAQSDGTEELTRARAQAGDEARRLAEQPPAEADRRDALDDLASRLDALARHLDSRGIDTARLRSIVDMVRDTTRSTSDRWERARALLTEFATPGTRPQRAFWKAR